MELCPGGFVTPAGTLFADARADQTVIDEDCDGQATVILDAGEPAAPISCIWSELLPLGTILAFEKVLGTSCDIEVPLDVGDHEITLTVTKTTDGAETEDSVVVTVTLPVECEGEAGGGA